MIDILRWLAEPRLRQQAEIEKYQTALERDIIVCWVRKKSTSAGLHCEFYLMYFTKLLKLMFCHTAIKTSAQLFKASLA